MPHGSGFTAINRYGIIAFNLDGGEISMRAYTGFFLVLLLAAYSVVSLIVDQKAYYLNSVKFKGDPIGLYQERFRGVRERMPPRGTFGYFSDITDRSEDRSALFLTQYALAPLVLRESTDLPVVVGNFHRGLPSRAEIRQKGLYLLFDTGKGVVLFGKAAPE